MSPVRSLIFDRACAWPEFSSKLSLFLLPYYRISSTRNLTFVCACARPEISSKLGLFMPPYHSISLVRNFFTFVCACAGPKISFQLYLLHALFWWNLKFFCTRAGPEFSSKLHFLRLELFWWNLTFVYACAGPKISFQLYLRLALLMGLTWISGVVAGGLDLEPVWYVFLVLNTLQVNNTKRPKTFNPPTVYLCQLWVQSFPWKFIGTYPFLNRLLAYRIWDLFFLLFLLSVLLLISLCPCLCMYYSLAQKKNK